MHDGLAIVYAVIIAALLGVIYQALGARAIFRFRERPERVIGARLRFHADEGLDPITPGLPVAAVQEYDGQRYRAVFEHPFAYGGQQRRFVQFSARHLGYPVSRVGRRRLLAINGELDGGDRFIGRIIRV